MDINSLYYSNTSHNNPDNMVTGRNDSNFLEGCKGEDTITIHRLESITMSLGLILMTLVAIFGNSLVIVALYKYKKLRTARNAFLCSLAVCDFLLPIIRLLSIAISMLYRRWIFGCTWCVLSSVIGSFLCSAMINNLCAITMERYLSIKYPLRYRLWVTKTTVIVTFLLICFVSLGMALLPYFRTGALTHFNSHILDCEFYLVRQPHLSLVLLILYFCLPFVIMVCAYTRIYYEMVLSNKRMWMSTSEALENTKRVKKEWKAAKMLIVIIAVFFLLWLPIFSVIVVKSYLPSLHTGWMARFSFCCAYIHSCCNWIIYSVMNLEMRSAFVQLLSINKKSNIMQTSELAHNICELQSYHKLSSIAPKSLLSILGRSDFYELTDRSHRLQPAVKEQYVRDESERGAERIP